MNLIILFPLLCGTGAILQHYNNIQQTYISFIHGQRDTPLPTAKVPQALQSFYRLPDKEHYTLKITAPFLTTFLETQAQNHHPADLRLLRGMNSATAQLLLPPQASHLKPQLTATIAQRQALSRRYLKQAEHHLFTRADVFYRLAQDKHLRTQLAPQVLKYYQEKDLTGLLAYIRNNGRSDSLDTILYLLISDLHTTRDGIQLVQQQAPALQNLYKGYAVGNNAQSIMKDVAAQIRDQHLRLLCCFRDSLTQVLNIQPLLRLEYLVRRPTSCVYAPSTYNKLNQEVKKLQELDIYHHYTAYTNLIIQMIEIYQVNYVINTIQSLRHKDPNYCNNMLTQLLCELPSITIVAVHKHNGQTMLLNYQNIDLFVKANL